MTLAIPSRRLLLTHNKGVSPISILGSALLAWWTADRADLITLNGSAVTSWRDVTHGYDAVQGVSAARPLYSATSFNGAPGVTFDGVDDCVVCTTAGLLAVLPGGASPSEEWILTEQSALFADGLSRVAFGYGGASSNVRRGIQRNTSGTNLVGAAVGTGGAISVVNAPAAEFSSRHAVRLAVGATSSTLALDGTAGTASAIIPNTGVDRVTIGATSNQTPGAFWSGEMRDALITTPLTTDQATQLQAYLMSRRRL